MADDAGSLLVRAGIIAQEQLRLARQSQTGHGGTVGEHLVLAGFVDDDELTAFYRNRLLVPRINPNDLTRIPKRCVDLVPADMAIEFRVIPVSIDREQNLTIAMGDPSNSHAVDEIAFFTGTYVVRAVATQLQIAWCLAHYYGVVTPLGETLLEEQELGEEQPVAGDAANGQDADAVIELVAEPLPKRTRGLTGKVDAMRHRVLAPVTAQHEAQRPTDDNIDEREAAASANRAHPRAPRVREDTGPTGPLKTRNKQDTGPTQPIKTRSKQDTGPTGPMKTRHGTADTKPPRRAREPTPPELFPRYGEVEASPEGRTKLDSLPTIVLAEGALSDSERPEDATPQAVVDHEAGTESRPILLEPRDTLRDVRLRPELLGEKESERSEKAEDRSGDDTETEAVPDQIDDGAEPSEVVLLERRKRSSSRRLRRTRLGLGAAGSGERREPRDTDQDAVMQDRSFHDTEVVRVPEFAKVSEVAAEAEEAEGEEEIPDVEDVEDEEYDEAAVIGVAKESLEAEDQDEDEYDDMDVIGVAKDADAKDADADEEDDDDDDDDDAPDTQPAAAPYAEDEDEDDDGEVAMEIVAEPESDDEVHVVSANELSEPGGSIGSDSRDRAIASGEIDISAVAAQYASRRVEESTIEIEAEKEEEEEEVDDDDDEAVEDEHDEDEHDEDEHDEDEHEDEHEEDEHDEDEHEEDEHEDEDEDEDEHEDEDEDDEELSEDTSPSDVVKVKKKPKNVYKEQTTKPYLFSSGTVDEGWGPPGTTIPPGLLGALPGALDSDDEPAAIPIPVEDPEQSGAQSSIVAAVRAEAESQRYSIPKEVEDIQSGPVELSPLESSSTRLVETLRKVDQARGRDQIIDCLLDHISESFERAGFFVVKSGVLTMFEARGVAMPNRSASLDLARPSTLQDVVGTRISFRGPLEDQLSRDFALKAMGGKLGDEVILVPLAVRGRVVGIVYGDHRTQPLFLEHVAAVTRAGGLALEKMLKASKRR